MSRLAIEQRRANRRWLDPHTRSIRMKETERREHEENNRTRLEREAAFRKQWQG